MRACSLIAMLSVAAATFVANTQASAGEVSRSGTIGRSDYAHEYFPECRVGLNVRSVVSSAAELSALLGYSDGGVIALGAQVFGEVRKHGGWLSKQFSRLEGGSKSTCVAICVQPPSGTTVRQARFYIDGHLCSHDGTSEWNQGSSGNHIQCGRGWSGLRDFSVGGEGACAVFANWKHNWTAQATLVLTYD